MHAANADSQLAKSLACRVRVRVRVRVRDRVRVRVRVGIKVRVRARVQDRTPSCEEPRLHEARHHHARGSASAMGAVDLLRIRASV